MMQVDYQNQENNNDFNQNQHAAHTPLFESVGGQRDELGKRTDVESTHVRVHTPVGEYDIDQDANYHHYRYGQEIDTLDPGHGQVNGISHSDRPSSDHNTVTANSASPFSFQLREGEAQEEGIGGQRKLSIQHLLDNGTGTGIGRPALHSTHSSPASNGGASVSSSPRYWNWPVPPTSTASASARAPAGEGLESPRSQSQAYSRSSTPSSIPFPAPKSRNTNVGAPSKRPVPISTGSSPFPYSSIRSSARASASPYPQIVTPIGLGINMDNSATASPPHTGEIDPSSSSPAGPGFTSPGGGSMSTSNRRGPVPAWPSPRKKEVRSASFGVGSHPAQTPREWYAQTPTILRVPPSASIHSPSTPVFIPGSSSLPRRPGPGLPANSAPVIGSARRVHLSDVPKSKVVNALNSKAAQYWFSPESSDCRVYVPLSRKRPAGGMGPGVGGKGGESDMEGTDSSPDSAMGEGPRGALWPPTPDPPAHAEGIDKSRMNVVNSHGKTSSPGRRGSMPEELDVPVLVFPLHRDYLIIQSTLLRALLSTTSIDMALRTSPTRPAFPPPSPAPALANRTPTPQARSFPTPRPGVAGAGQKERSLKGAKILPPKEGEPVSLFLPLPDPASFGVILHWLYWGDVASLESALSRGLITWQGIVKNIEYLSMDDSIKRVMGKWWRTWVKTDVGRARAQEEAERTKRETSVSASSEGGDGDVSDVEDEGMQVDGGGRESVAAEEEDGVSDLLKRL